MSAARATSLVRQMVAKESSGSGDTEPALRRLARRYGIGFWTLSHLRKGNAKTCDASLYARVKAAYLDLCERQIAALQLEISSERAVSDNDDLSNMAAEAAALAAKVQAQKLTMTSQ